MKKGIQIDFVIVRQNSILTIKTILLSTDITWQNEIILIIVHLVLLDIQLCFHV